MRRAILLFVFAASVLGACAAAPPGKPAEAAKAITGNEVASATPRAEDACHASRFRYLIGKPRSAIPPKPEGANWRIACTTCAVTLEYAPARLNIFFDAKTDAIKDVKCG